MMYRAVIIGFAHMHINDVARHFYNNPYISLVACADTVQPVPGRIKAPYTREWNKNFCVVNFYIPKVYDDYREMLKMEKPDLAIVTSENVMHREIVEESARLGVGVCVEKPMAVSMSDALAMYRATSAANVPLLVNWPVTWIPAYMTLRELLSGGEIGKALEFKIRTSHTGPLGKGAKHKGVSETAHIMTNVEKGATWWHKSSQGGGAMLDFCCYGCMLSRWLLNEDAQGVFAMRANLDSNYGDADDNAAMLIRYPKSLASVETSWTTPCDLIPSNMPMIYGTSGAMTVVSTNEGECVRIVKPGEPERIVSPGRVESSAKNIAEACVICLDSGAVPHETLSPEINLAAMSILDAGLRSSSSGRLELVNNIHWQIG